MISVRLDKATPTLAHPGTHGGLGSAGIEGIPQVLGALGQRLRHPVQLPGTHAVLEAGQGGLGSKGITGPTRLQEALRGLNPRLRAGSEWIPLDLDVARASSLKNLYITTDEGRLDCLGFVEGIGAFNAVRFESEEFDVGGYSCRVLGLDALIRSKEALGRPHDLQSLVQLKAIRERNGNV